MRKFQLKTQEIRDNALQFISELPLCEYEVIVKEYHETRTLEQNAKMWAMLRDISKQVIWYENKLTPEEWKDVLTAGLKAQRAVPGIDGGFVILGEHTSKMSMADMAKLIELSEHFGGLKEVKWGK